MPQSSFLCYQTSCNVATLEITSYIQGILHSPLLDQKNALTGPLGITADIHVTLFTTCEHLNGSSQQFPKTSPKCAVHGRAPSHLVADHVDILQ